MKGLKPSFAPTTMTHDYFMDDTIIMGNVSIAKAKNFLQILKAYEVASQQNVNVDKSKLFFTHSPIRR